MLRRHQGLYVFPLLAPRAIEVSLLVTVVTFEDIKVLVRLAEGFAVWPPATSFNNILLPEII
eukprot:4779990-Amphidinium_carterae.1